MERTPSRRFAVARELAGRYVACIKMPPHAALPRKIVIFAHRFLA